VTTSEFVETIYELTLEDCWIIHKSISEQQIISRERGGSIIYEDVDIRLLYAKGVLSSLNADLKVNVADHLSKFGIFSARSK